MPYFGIEDPSMVSDNYPLNFARDLRGEGSIDPGYFSKFDVAPEYFMGGPPPNQFLTGLRRTVFGDRELKRQAMADWEPPVPNFDASAMLGGAPMYADEGQRWHEMTPEQQQELLKSAAQQGPEGIAQIIERVAGLPDAIRAALEDLKKKIDFWTSGPRSSVIGDWAYRDDAVLDTRSEQDAYQNTMTPYQPWNEAG